MPVVTPVTPALSKLIPYTCFFSRLIRDSAPHINTIVIIGCIVMLLGCYLLGIDSKNPPQPSDADYVDKQDEDVPMDVFNARNHRYKVICTVRNSMVICG